MEISYQTIKEKMLEYGYYAEDELIWQTYINIQNILNKNQVGQNVFALCLEGPPGSGKTKYAKIYSKVLSDFLGEDVVLIDYQCDSETGREELYEEIRVASAIVGDREELIIAGKLMATIDAANKGKKVILFLDEYDKAREQTDTYLLDFIQDGRINATQRGDIEIKQENLQNVQVIIGKNQMREHLSEPLERRIKILKLHDMEPSVFYKVANDQFPDGNKDVINLVVVLYTEIYNKKGDFSRMTSCAEGLLAIKDASTLLKANAPTKFIYSAILANMLKNPDDIETFGELVKKNEKLSDFFEASCKLSGIKDPTEAGSVRREILSIFFSEDIKQISEEIERANRLLTRSDNEISYLEKKIDEQDKTIEEQKKYIKQLLGREKGKNVDLPQNEDEESQEKIQELPNFMQIGDDYRFTSQDEIQGQILYDDTSKFHLKENILDQEYEYLQDIRICNMEKLFRRRYRTSTAWNLSYHI